MIKALVAMTFAIASVALCPSWTVSAYVPPTSPCGPGAGSDCPPPRDGLA